MNFANKQNLYKLRKILIEYFLTICTSMIFFLVGCLYYKYVKKKKKKFPESVKKYTINLERHKGLFPSINIIYF